MKIKLSELRQLIRESVEKVLQEDDIDWNLTDPMKVKEFWEDTTNGQKQLINALFSNYNKDVLSYLTKETELLSKEVGNLTDDEFELIYNVKDDPRVRMISDSEDQTLLNLLQEPTSLEELKKLAMDWNTERTSTKERRVADVATRKEQDRLNPAINESRKRK